MLVCVCLPNCLKVHNNTLFFPLSTKSNNRVDSLLTNSKVGGGVHDLAVRGGILNYGGCTLSPEENESWSLMFLISKPSTNAALHQGIQLPLNVACSAAHIRTYTH